MITIEKNKRYTGSRERESLFDVFYKKDGKPKPIIIFSHGFKGFKDFGCFDLMAKFFAKRDYIFIKHNFSYNGGTVDQPVDFPDLKAFSQNNFSTELNDLNIMINLILDEKMVQKKEIDNNKLFLMGHSRGGGITVLKTAQDARVKASAIMASVADYSLYFPEDKEILDHWKKEKFTYIENTRTLQKMPLDYQLYEDYIENKENLDIMKHANTMKQKCLIIHGEKDETVSVNAAFLLDKTIQNSELFVLKEANHSFDNFHPYTEKEMPKYFLLAMEKTHSFFQSL